MKPIIQQFVADIIFCDRGSGDGLTKISLSEAAINLREWAASGVDVPDGMTAEDLMTTWNDMI